MDSGQVWRALRRGWLVVLLFVVGALAVSVVYLRAAPASFTARADVYVTAIGGLTVTELNSGSTFALQQAENLSLIATREPVLGPVINRLGLEQTPEQLAESVTATVLGETSVISLEVVSGSPRDAAIMANAVAESLSTAAPDLMPPARKGAAAVRVQVVQRAKTPTGPSRPSVPFTTLVGLATGLLLGLAAALLLEARNARVSKRVATEAGVAQEEKPTARAVQEPTQSSLAHGQSTT